MFKYIVVYVQQIYCSGSTGALCDLVVDIVRYASGCYGSGGGDLLCSSLL